MKEEIDAALEVIRKGGLILYPTDTIWGIGCDATNADAVQRIYALKKRADNKSMIVLIEDAARLNRHVKEVPDVAWDLVELADQPLTIIYPGAMHLAANVVAEDGSIGIRVCQDEFCRQLIRRFNKPLVSTSANVSGQAHAACFDDISEEIKKGVDYIVNHRRDDKSRRAPSSVIKISLNGQITILRK